MRALIFLLLLLLSACSSAPEKPIDPSCIQAGKYAKIIAQLRDIGVPQADIKQFSSSPRIYSFPVQLLQEEVYARPDLNHFEIEALVYDMCTTVGYTELLKKLKSVADERREMQELINLKPERAPK